MNIIYQCIYPDFRHVIETKNPITLPIRVLEAKFSRKILFINKFLWQRGYDPNSKGEYFAISKFELLSLWSVIIMLYTVDTPFKNLFSFPESMKPM